MSSRFAELLDILGAIYLVFVKDKLSAFFGESLKVRIDR